MSPSIQGADADQLDRLAVLFQEKAQQLDNLGNQVRKAVNQVHWEGGGWGRFRAEWDQQHHKRLRVASQGLRQASDQLRSQAQDQRRVSGTGAGSHGARRLGVEPLVGLGALPGLSSILLGGSSTLISEFLDQTRKGKGAAWKSGMGFMSKSGIHASSAKNISKVFVPASLIFAGIEGYGASRVQAIRDSSDGSLDNTEAASREWASGVAIGGLRAGAAIGIGAVGAVILPVGAPVVLGVLVGVGVGVVGSYVLDAGLGLQIGSKSAEEHIAEFGADVGDGLVDGVRAVRDGTLGISESLNKKVADLWPL